MLVRLNSQPKLDSLQATRLKFMKDLDLDVDDFYVEGPLVIIEQEDNELMPVKDSQSIWLNVNLWKSYYGPGYKRGDINLFIRCAEWLEQHFDHCQVYYGHDVNDENVELFSKAMRECLLTQHRQDRNTGEGTL